ncbi:hypothetical protein G7057_02675 [Jeotgalibaca arthritidis]|uniref:Transposase for insertion sequence element IS21-like C-terminal domain-containing protein n=1 Tax=Jeotgalibaca arthritidis TaxID=1868794 RepID=A0A6G7K892_9LACT|nr:hypothetical protein [Jeotgalibaca arthritidis]QII81483.1 hypothetical protein G7057_02675 [Jeotgalibaca arthritidis]
MNKYSHIQFESNAYSVPDYLVGQTVQLKVYHDYFVVYAHHTEVCHLQKQKLSPMPLKQIGNA